MSTEDEILDDKVRLCEKLFDISLLDYQKDILKEMLRASYDRGGEKLYLIMPPHRDYEFLRHLCGMFLDSFHNYI